MAIYGLAARALLFAAPSIPAATAAAGVLGVIETLTGLKKVWSSIVTLASGGDERLAKEIVALQRERGPDDTFTLERGTDWRREGDEIVITASAVRRLTSGDSDDYAWFVERGTDDTEAQPYFWDSAAERFAAWGRDMDQILDTAAAEFNAG
jgi:hypothetical protein